jgi:hypothetical protein
LTTNPKWQPAPLGGSGTWTPVVVLPGRKHLGNVELRGRTADTPRFTFGIVKIAHGRELAPHVHAVEDDAAYS